MKLATNLYVYYQVFDCICYTNRLVEYLAENIRISSAGESIWT